MSQEAKIGDPHVSVGLVAGDGGALHLAAAGRLRQGAQVPFHRRAARRRRGRAHRPGHRGAAARQTRCARCDALAQRIAAGATKAIRWTKIATNLPLRALFHAHFDAGLAYECLSNRSADHAEAVRAFRERRKPQFTGH